MALVRIDFSNSQAQDFGQVTALLVNRIMAEVLNVPEHENYIIGQAHERSDLLHNPANVAPARLADIVFIQITLNSGRSPELKTNFYDALTTAICADTLVKSENIFINLVEVAKENWSFGKNKL